MRGKDGPLDRWHGWSPTYYIPSLRPPLSLLCIATGSLGRSRNDEADGEIYTEEENESSTDGGRYHVRYVLS